MSDTDIAVVGMGGRFPMSPDLSAFWKNVAEGRECISFFSADEVEVADALKEHPDYVAARAVMDGAADFDAGFFGMTPAEAKATDPQHRVLLEVAFEALEDAAIDPGRSLVPIGVFAGADINSYAVGHLLWTHDLQSLIGNDKDYLATRIAWKLDLRGSALTLQTACSTSLVAIVQACQALLGFQCDVALAGGVGIAFPQKAGYLYQEGGILSPDGHCRTFDADSKGTVGGDGCGMVVLKRLEDALADGDPIRAVIKGAAVNNDGSAKVGFTAPSVQGQAEVIAMAQGLGEVDPSTIGYVECHGTATQLGDPIEVAALTEVFRESTDEVQFCRIGSLKSNMGHMNSAAGVGGFIKAVMALEHRQVPPSLHFERANPELGLDQSPFRVVTTLEPWTERLRAGVSSFGVGGTNAHVVLEVAPDTEQAAGEGMQLLLVSAHTEAALEQACEALGPALTDQNLAAAAWTLQSGRRLQRHQRFVVAESAEQARLRLRSTPSERVEADSRKLAFLFPGQGAQHAGMARGLHDDEPVFRAAMDRCLGLLDLPAGWWDDDQALQRTENTQPALFAVCWSLAELYARWGVQADAFLGHSVGEYVAACRAGVFSLEDGLRMVATRGRLVQAMEPGSMLAVSLDEGAARSTGLEVAALNAPGVTVLCGPDAQVAQVEQSLRAQGVAATRLHTSHAFHSASMEPMLADFRKVVAGVQLSPPQVRVVSNLTGAWLSDQQATDPEYWVRHVREPVRFSDGLGLLAEDHRFVEVGPGRNLTGLVRKHGIERVTPSLRHARQDLDDRVAIRQALGRLAAAGTPVRWDALYSQPPRRIHLPGTPMQRERYWQGFDLTQVGSAKGGREALSDWLYHRSWRLGLAPAPADPEGWLDATDELPDDGALRLIFRGDLGELFELGHSLSGREVELLVVGEGMVSPLGTEEVDPLRAALVPAAQVLGQELGWTVRVVDGELTPGELGCSEALVALRPGQRWVMEHRALEPSSLGPEVALGDTLLVIGGLGSVGLHLAGRLAREGRHLHLTSRSGLVARSEWEHWLTTHAPSDVVSQRIRAIQTMEGVGATITVHSADVADRARMAEVLERIGPVDTVLHCAGEGGARSFAGATETTAAHMAAQLRARLDGCEVLQELLPAGSRVVLTSSLSTAIGGVGLAAYAAANRALETFARNPGWTAIAWDAWQPLAGRLTGPLGAFAMSPQEGAQVLSRALRSSADVVIVSTIDLETRVAHAEQAQREHHSPTAGERHARPELETDYVAPSTDTERVVTELWEELFGIEPIGVQDNFFQLGGDSLMAIQLSTRLRDRLGVDLAVNDLFEEATIASVAVRVDRALEQARAQEAELENMLAMVEHMSEDEVEKMLSELGT